MPLLPLIRRRTVAVQAAGRALVAAGLTVLAMAGAEAACPELEARVEKAAQAHDTSALKEVRSAVAAEPACAPGFLRNLDMTIGAALVRPFREAKTRTASGNAELGTAELKEAVDVFGYRREPWVLERLGKEAFARRAYGEAARRFQDAAESAHAVAPDGPSWPGYMRASQEAAVLTPEALPSLACRSCGTSPLLGPRKTVSLSHVWLIPVTFEAGKAVLSPKGKTVMANLIKDLVRAGSPPFWLRVVSDADGSLARARGDAIKAAVVKSSGYGAEIRVSLAKQSSPYQPVLTLSKEESRAFGERFELRVQPPPQTPPPPPKAPEVRQ